MIESMKQSHLARKETRKKRAGKLKGALRKEVKLGKIVTMAVSDKSD